MKPIDESNQKKKFLLHNKFSVWPASFVEAFFVGSTIIAMLISAFMGMKGHF